MGIYSALLQSRPATGEPEVKTEPSPTTEINLPEKKEPVSTVERNSVRKSERFEPSSSALPYKRRTKRYSFEFYDDQILAIKRLVYEANLSGETISQSDIVRMALDEYLKTKEK